MARLDKYLKQPADVQDYDITYVDWLTENGDTALSAEVTVQTGITLDSYELFQGIVKVWLSGGTTGEQYKITCSLTTANLPARIKQHEILIRVVDS